MVLGWKSGRSSAPSTSSRFRAAGFVLLAALLLVAGWPTTPALDDTVGGGPNRNFHPTPEQSRAGRELIRRLESVHYLRREADDSLSQQIFDNYIEFLDPSRSILLAADYGSFAKWRNELDDLIMDRDLEPAFAMFNRYHERQLKRLAWVIEVLEGDLSDLPIGGDEELELDREDAPWAESVEELDEFWRRRLASQIIGLELAGRTREEARERLLERQQEQLRRAGQYHGQDVFQFFMTAITDAYDPHTQFMVPRLADNFDMRMSLSFEGIGAVLRPDGEYAVIERIIPAGPADKDGRLQPGDKVVGVAQGVEGDMVDVIGWRLDDAVQLIRGEEGSTVRLNVRTADAPEGAPPKIYNIQRERVKLEEQSASSEIYEVSGGVEVARVEGSERGGRAVRRDAEDSTDAGTQHAADALASMLGEDGESLRIGVVDLPTFYMDTEAANRGDPDFKSTTRDVARLLHEMTADGLDGVILDLRGNGGGSLTEAHELAGLVLGRKPVVQVRDYTGDVQVLKGSGDAAWTGPLVVLVDRLSASASEIVAAAVQDHRRGLVLGERTFGKGTVQAVTSAANGRLLVTIAKFYRVTGESTQHAGVMPDISFPATYDPEEIGESSMEGALEWDVIDSLPLRKLPPADSLIPAAIPSLRARSLARASVDPDLDRLSRELELLRSVRDDTTVSLSLEMRRAEQEEYDEQRMGILNAWRVAKGFPPLQTDEEDEAVAAVMRPGDEGEPTEETEAASTTEGAVALADPPSDTDPASDAAPALEAEVADTTPAAPQRVDAWLQEAARVLADLIAENQNV